VSAAARFADVIDDEETREALAKLLAERAPETLERALGSRSKPEAAPRGRLLTVLGARGGVGATTFAVNVAWLLAHDAPRKVALVDLDLRFGTVALSLDLEPTHGLREVLESPDRIDSLFVSSAMARESETLSVLSAEEPPGDRLKIEPAAFDALAGDLRGNFDWIVVDAARGSAVPEERLLAQSDKIVLVSDLSLAGMRDAVRLAGWIRSVAARAEFLVVVNKQGAHAKAEVPRADFERGVEAKIAQLLPYDPKVAGAASNAGRPIAVAAKGSALAKALRQSANMIAGPEASARAKAPIGLFRRK
jgi:pilus assembly protein CpaE